MSERGLTSVKLNRVQFFSSNYYCYIASTSAVSRKNTPDIFDCNLKKDYQILTSLNTNIPDITSHQTTVQFPTSPNVCFCTTWWKQKNEILHFYPRQYYYLIKIMQNNVFCPHLCHFGWQFTQLSIFFQLPTVKMFDMSAHHANTDMEMLSPFVEAVSIMFCSRPMQTSPVTSWIHQHS